MYIQKRKDVVLISVEIFSSRTAKGEADKKMKCRLKCVKNKYEKDT